jgi:hypothetical protein
MKINRNFEKLFIFIGLVFSLQCCSVVENYPSNVQVESKEGTFNYSMKGAGSGKSIKLSVENAEKNIFEVIMFRGIVGTDLQIPLVENEVTSRDQNKKFYDGFFGDKIYRNFITSSVEKLSPSEKVKGGFKTSVKFSINLAALRVYLEQNKIIRTFGY